MEPLKVKGWFKVIMPHSAIPSMPKVIAIDKDDWGKPLIRSLVKQGCTFEPVYVFTDEELKRYIAEKLTEAMARDFT